MRLIQSLVNVIKSPLYFRLLNEVIFLIAYLFFVLTVWSDLLKDLFQYGLFFAAAAWPATARRVRRALSSRPGLRSSRASCGSRGKRSSPGQS